MDSQIIKIARLATLATAIAVVGMTGFANEKPSPTPTPRPAGGKSLNDVAKDKKLKGDTKGGSSGSIVISNENLSDYASQGGLTTAQPNSKGKGTRSLYADPASKVIDAETAATNERMIFWQGKYRAQMERIVAIKRQIEDLDYEIPGLWNDYYSRDDPAYRDSVIKPKLDKALERRDTLEGLLQKEEPKLQQIREDARKDGGEPGWFRGLKMPTPLPGRTDDKSRKALEITDR